jgi:pyridoxal phosphate enzyme (YggS family)
MHELIKNLESVKHKINEKVKLSQKTITQPTIIAISKTFSLDHINPLIEAGHTHFGENKVQEAEKKWDKTLINKHGLKLHMVGGLQSNKAKKAVQIFDYIHSLDNLKLAKKLHLAEEELNKNLKYFVQVNLGNEDQKSGIPKSNLEKFIETLRRDFKLNIIGLMCLPPQNEKSEIYFKELQEFAIKHNFNHLSMGMSHDYLAALDFGSSFLRLGTCIFGERKS